MTTLVDTNIFLEILLAQANKENCKQFLQEHAGECALSDFSLHSIGVIAFRIGRPQVFRAFLKDTLPCFGLLHLDKNGYVAVLQAQERFGLDFDDAYQLALARSHGLSFVTQDRDFERVKTDVLVRLL